DGAGRLEIRDLWFDDGACMVQMARTTELALKAVAWVDGKPWLFAMRDDNAITFVAPRTDDMSTDAITGTPVTVRGGFTRVTLPIARHGASAVVTTMASLEFRIDHPPTSDTDTQSTNVAIEIGKTMSESAPTVFVRRTTTTKHVTPAE